mmetsp:Transcript_1938/g.3808  ORF Transcript_1938/g.3808 Transcript_1938/m.3808 type:complete len:226 (+) Transcript_1938:295-972(+)
MPCRFFGRNGSSFMESKRARLVALFLRVPILVPLSLLRRWVRVSLRTRVPLSLLWVPSRLAVRRVSGAVRVASGWIWVKVQSHSMPTELEGSGSSINPRLLVFMEEATTVPVCRCSVRADRRADRADRKRVWRLSGVSSPPAELDAPRFDCLEVPSPFRLDRTFVLRLDLCLVPSRADRLLFRRVPCRSVAGASSSSVMSQSSLEKSLETSAQVSGTPLLALLLT